MTEKEKCAQGLLYDANYDPQLLRDRDEAKSICQTFNTLPYGEKDQKKALLQKLLSPKTDNFIIEPPFWCDYGYNIEIGENFYANHGLVILDGAKVKFGSNVFIAPNCQFYTAGHPENIEKRNEGLEYAMPITVGDNVWIGGNVTVLPGISIGEGSIIGAGSVVTKDIPSGVIAVGNPCKVLREVNQDK